MDVHELAEVLAQTRQWQTLTTPGDEESYEGRDLSGTVTARVDATGALTSVSIADRWAQRLSAAELGPAIREAAAAAVSARYGFAPPAPGAAAVDWGQAFDALIAAPAAPVTTDDVARAEAYVAEAATMIGQESARLSVGDARERFLGQLDRFTSRPSESFARSRRPDAVGSAAQVELQLSPEGLMIGCTVNARWAGTQSGHMLTMRLAELLATYQDGR